VTARDGGNADFAGAKICPQLYIFLSRKAAKKSNK
jgi:hypothetical protein